jgi:DNA-binding GntR family transcriptional regulator
MESSHTVYRTPHERLFEQVDLASVPVRDKAHDVLKRAIIEGKLAPGERLVESQIADGLNISRTPLREAILRLEAEGFLQRHANGSVYVKRLSVADVQGLYAARSVLEGLAAREAASRITVAQLARLDAILAEVREAGTAATDVSRLAELGEEFHRIIIEASGNTTCAELLHFLRDRIAQHRHFTMAMPSRQRAAARELGAVLTQLRRRNPEAAERAARRHVLQAGRCMLRALKAGDLDPRERTGRVAKPVRKKQGLAARDSGR